jgi:hypothetical protein
VPFFPLLKLTSGEENEKELRVSQAAGKNSFYL